jgi:DNA end-binding protein Ku
LPTGDTIILTDEDFADLPLPTAHVVDVLQFVPLDQVDPIYFARSYYLEPEKTAVKPYALLRDALDESGMVGLVKVAIRSREQLATLRVRDGVIVMETMIWPDEVREPGFSFLDEDVDLRPQERQMAKSLVESMAGDFDPDQYSDEYRAALQEVIDAKIEGREVVAPTAEQPDTGTVVDLMAALRASVEAAKRGRGEAADSAADGAQSSSPSRTATKAPAKKAPAKATAKAPAKKAAARPAKTASASSATPPAKKTTQKAAARRKTA